MSLWYEDELGWNYCTFCDVWELSLSEDESESEEQHIWRCQKISSKETVSRKYNRKTIFFIISKDKVRNYSLYKKHQVSILPYMSIERVTINHDFALNPQTKST
jgi:hypothetical protein